MRRVAMALFGTLFGTTLLVGLKAHGNADVPGADSAVATTPQDPAAGNSGTRAKTRTILGPAIEVIWQGRDYGNTQVRIVVTGKHIDDISTVQHSGRPRDVSTVLRAQALAAQSADVGNVSGATASSDAYKRSLREAIKKI
jgi:hypothetical protein